MARLYSYTIYRQDGSIEDIDPRKKMELAELQAAVGGHIELVPKHFTVGKLKGRFTAFCNEDGKFNGSAMNPHFNRVNFVGFLNPSNGTTDPWDDWITGDVIVERYAGKEISANV